MHLKVKPLRLTKWDILLVQWTYILLESSSTYHIFNQKETHGNFIYNAHNKYRLRILLGLASFELGLKFRKRSQNKSQCGYEHNTQRGKSHCLDI